MKTTGIAFTLWLLAATGIAHADATTDFQTLLDEHWEWRLQSAPLMASMMGDRRFNRDWTDSSIDAIEQRARTARDGHGVERQRCAGRTHPRMKPSSRANVAISR